MLAGEIRAARERRLPDFPNTPGEIVIAPVVGLAPDGVKLEKVFDYSYTADPQEDRTLLVYGGNVGDREIFVAVNPVLESDRVTVGIASTDDLAWGRVQPKSNVKTLFASEHAKMQSEVYFSGKNVKTAVEKVAWTHLCVVSEIQRGQEQSQSRDNQGRSFDF